MQYMTSEERLIKLDKMTNTRDLGGYETQEGRYTKAHHFIRASSPANATKEDLVYWATQSNDLMLSGSAERELRRRYGENWRQIL